MPIQQRIHGTTASAIAASLEAAIQRGDYVPGEEVPSVRALAIDLEVSPGTVAAAYRALRSRGLISTRPGSGTRISYRPALPVAYTTPPPAGIRDLAFGNPDPELLPPLAGVLRALEPRHRLYDEPTDSSELIDLADRRFREAGAPTGSITLANGALDGVERVLQAQLRPGDRVAIEDPAYVGVMELVGALSLIPEPVRIDDMGPDPADLDRALGTGVRAVLITPRSQNPTGAAIDEPRAALLRAVVQRHPDVLVVEDDHGGAVSGVPLVTVASEGMKRWALIHSVAKSLGPDLRVAFVTGDSQTVGRVEGRRLVGQGWVSHLLQQAVYKLWSDPSVDRTLQVAARTYATRRQALLDALARRDIEAHGRSGMNVWIPVRQEGHTVQALLGFGWAVRAGEPFRLQSPPAIRVTTSTLDPEEAERFAGDLQRIHRPAVRRRSA